MGFLKRRESWSSPPPGSGSSVGCAGDSSRYPALLEFLLAESWPDGAPREPGTLLVFSEAGVLKACLVDKAQQLVGFLTLGSAGLTGALDLVEAALVAASVDWRPQRSRGKR